VVDAALSTLELRDSVSEIDKLLDELESYAEKSPWYLPNKIVIKDEDFFRITQRIRELMPAELADSRKVLEKRDLILKNAQEEHRRIIETAEKRLEDMTREDQVVVAAQSFAERLVEKARLEAAGVKREALQYTAELLADMEKQFGTTLVTLQKGRAYLEQEINSEMAQNEAADNSAEGAQSSTV
jgi:cell division septum initiation protein DivIVA